MLFRSVAIAGMGGIGGIDAVTLARMGVGRFTIADPDTFDVANTNRQYGAAASTLDQPKAEVMAAMVRDINPDADVRVLPEPVNEENVDEFLADADLFIDAIEVFNIAPRRLLFARAAGQGIYGITAGPVGFSGVWLVFDPRGMSFDRYFDLRDGMSDTEMVASFIIGVAPKATHRGYTDLKYIDVNARTGPSCSLACQLASGALACEALKTLLNRGRLRAAPWYNQFDPYVGRFIQRRLLGGNRHPVQRLKKRLLLKYITES